MSDEIKLSRREWNALGSLMLPMDLGGKRTLGPKTAAKLLALGFVEPCEERINGSGRSPLDRIPMVIKGYRMTLAGNIAYRLLAPDDLPTLTIPEVSVEPGKDGI